MKSVDEPESPSLLARRPARSRSRRCAAASATSSRVDLDDAARSSTSPTDDFADYGADLLARRQVPRLQRARQRQPEAVPARPRHQEEDADHLRHARRDRGAVHRRPHDRVLVDRHRSGGAARAGGREERQHLQHLDARPDAPASCGSTPTRSAATVSPVVLQRGQTQPRSRSSATTRASYEHPHARAQGAAAHRGERRLRRAGPDHRLPGAAAAHARRGERSARRGTFEKMFLEGRPPVNVGVTSNGDVFGGTQISFGDVLGDKQFNVFAASIAQYRTLSLSLRQPVAPLPVRAAGLLADAVLLRRSSRASSTTRRSRRSSAATRRSRRGPCAAAARSASTRSTATAASSCRGGFVQLERGVQRPGPAGVLATSISSRPYGRRCSATARWCRSASRSSRRRRSSASSDRWPATRCGSRYDVAPKIGGLLSRQTFDVDARYYQRLGTSGVLATALPRLQEHRRLPRLHCTSAATPRCAATTTSSSSARTSSSPTPSCASRSSRRRSRRSASSAASAACSSPTSAAAGSTTRASSSSTERRRAVHDRSSTTSATPLGADHRRSDHRPADPDLRADADRQRLPPAGRPRVVRHRPRDLRARLPDSLRLVVAHAVQQGVGGRRSSPPTAAAAEFRKPRFAVWIGYDF